MGSHRINADTVGVVDILIPGEAAVDRLAQQRGHAVLDVAAGAEVEELGRARRTRTSRGNWLESGRSRWSG